jgi:hypothetical protein
MPPHSPHWWSALLALAATAGLAAAPGRAAAAFAAYDSTANGNFGVFGLLSGGTYMESFSTGTDPVELTSVTAVFNKYANDSGTTTALLLADAGNAPGALLSTIGTVDNGTLANGSVAATFTPASPYLLAANTRYWVQMTEPTQPGGAGMGWAWSFHTGGTGVAGEYADFNGSVRPTSSFGTYLMRVEVDTPTPPPVTSSPAPAGLVLGATGIASLLGYGGLRRRRTNPQA